MKEEKNENLVWFSKKWDPEKWDPNNPLFECKTPEDARQAQSLLNAVLARHDSIKDKLIEAERNLIKTEQILMKIVERLQQ